MTAALTRPQSRPRLVATVLLAIAVVAAIVVGVLWWGWNADHRRAAARDAAVDGARQAVIDIQTFNTKDPDGTLRRMESVMTGDLRKSWDESQRAYTQDRLKERANVDLRTEPVVASAAPTEFDYDAGTAKVLIYLVVKFTEDGKLSDDAYRWTYIISMAKVDGAWKASDMVPLQQRGAIGPSDPTAPATGAAPTGEATAPSSSTPTAPTPEGGTP